MNPVDTERFVKNLDKARHLAEMAKVSSVIITGKTEPLTNMEMVKVACKAFSDFPLEIQTNGILLLNKKNIHLLDDLRVDTVAISIDNLSQIYSLREAIDQIKELGMTVRVTVNLSREVTEPFYDDEVKVYGTRYYHKILNNIVKMAKFYGIDQVSFRKITIPLNPVNTPESIKAQEWIKNHAYSEEADAFFDVYADFIKKNGIKVAELAFGAVIYMYEGISFTYFDYCIQDENNGENIRSLIYYEDGHMSTTWYGSNHGRIF